MISKIYFLFFSDQKTVLDEAVRLKHEADIEKVPFKQVMLYLDAVKYFLLTGSFMEETKVDLKPAFNMYKETLHLIRWVVWT